MYRPRPLDTKNLKCHVCGNLAKWRDREFHASYVLGEALCDACEKKFTFTSTEFESLLDKASQPVEQEQKPAPASSQTSESQTTDGRIRELQSVILEAKKQGARELAEWIKTHSQVEHCDRETMAYFEDYIWMDKLKWQDKLKELGR